MIKSSNPAPPLQSSTPVCSGKPRQPGAIPGWVLPPFCTSETIVTTFRYSTGVEQTKLSYLRGSRPGSLNLGTSGYEHNGRAISF